MMSDEPCRYSVVSLGTERHRARTEGVRGGQYGYINLSYADGSYRIRALPHGASGPSYGALECSASSLETVAMARMQLITASGLLNQQHKFDLDKPVLIIGSGAVAVGAVLELKRLGVQSSLTLGSTNVARKKMNEADHFSYFDANTDDRKFATVIDAVATSESLKLAIDRCEKGGTIGILGSPRERPSFDLYSIHKQRLTLVGLHELATTHQQRQWLLNEILIWIEHNWKEQAIRSCRIHSSIDFIETYRRILFEDSTSLIHAFDWGHRK